MRSEKEVYDGIYVSEDSVVEDGAEIYAPAHISDGSHVCSGAVIMPFCRLSHAYVCGGARVYSSTIENSFVSANCAVGPYAYLRGGAYVGENCRIGDFVEIKNSRIGDGSKAAHLAYVGDAVVGKGVNIGCGAVFCNYDGKVKSETVVGDGAFIGANCNIVAPVKIGAGAYIAAGTTVTEDVESADFVIGRARQSAKRGGAAGRYAGGGERNG